MGAGLFAFRKGRKIIRNRRGAQLIHSFGILGCGENEGMANVCGRLGFAYHTSLIQ
ncbi:MAG: hypothetical protein GDA42_05125 [Ekhidna sp.]|nr:hypothetical protein [Ekhidna sp.]